MDPNTPAGIEEYVQALKGSERLKDRICHHRVLPGRPALYEEPVRPFSAALRRLLAARGLTRLYSHQVLASSLARAGRHVVAATPTASGKTLSYTLPVLDQILADPAGRALFLFPLKALAQDQLRSLEEFLAPLPVSARPTAAIYDGDTSPYRRKKLRENPPNILLTNPEMLHLSLLPHHQTWATFLAGLTYVVVDEVHTYRGVMGSHMAHVFRRLERVCARFGAKPTFVFCSATIGNPAQLASKLTALPVETVSESGAPTGKRHFLFINPLEGASNTAILLLKAALHRGLRTIVYAQSRKMVELIALWASQRAGPMADKISAYRAGFLPEERRDIEARMTSGELLAVVTTSALELGIDIGGLDLCILVGYPGTVMSTWQRGGRVGRGQNESAVVLVAGEDALDQYFMRHPEDFFERPPEDAVVNPDNPAILARHLECAAAELPLGLAEPWLQHPPAAELAHRLTLTGKLLLDKEGSRYYAARKMPHREVDLRGAGGRYHIEDQDGQGIGFVDEHRAFRETHPGAVYLHRGKTYLVSELSLSGRVARVQERKVDYYTRVRGAKTTEILQAYEHGTAFGARVGFGHLKVTETITGYERRKTRGGQLLNIVPLDLPPLTFETEGLWFEIPRAVQDETERRLFHFMGGIHAAEHAAIAVLPLLVLTDRNDLGGISTPLHPQLDRAAVFIYDAMPGGVGLTRQAFVRMEELFERTLAAITACGCENGCPSCVHSPKCGSGNRPIDKIASQFLLQSIMAQPPEEGPGAVLELLHPPAQPVPPDQGQTTPTWEQTSGRAFGQSFGHPPGQPQRQGASGENEPEQEHGRITRQTDGQVSGSSQSGQGRPGPTMQGHPSFGQVLPGQDRPGSPPTAPARFAVMDLETQLSAQEVGGWHLAARMKMSLGVVYDSVLNACRTFLEPEAGAMVAAMRQADLVVGFNIKRFDYSVLGAYGDFKLSELPTLDMLEHIHARLGVRVSLDTLAQATLGAAKSADGLKALTWWKEGRIDKIEAYCRQDVEITRDLYLFGRDNGYLLYTNKARKVVRCPVTWE